MSDSIGHSFLLLWTVIVCTHELVGKLDLKLDLKAVQIFWDKIMSKFEFKFRWDPHYDNCGTIYERVLLRKEINVVYSHVQFY